MRYVRCQLAASTGTAKPVLCTCTFGWLIVGLPASPKLSCLVRSRLACHTEPQSPRPLAVRSRLVVPPERPPASRPGSTAAPECTLQSPSGPAEKPVASSPAWPQIRIQRATVTVVPCAQKIHRQRRHQRPREDVRRNHGEDHRFRQRNKQIPRDTGKKEHGQKYYANTDRKST